MNENFGLNDEGQVVITNQPNIDIDQVPNSDWTDEEWNTFRSWLKDALHHQTIQVTFTKKDGTERVMKCTLREDILPKVEIKESSTRKTNDANLAVFDVEANGWRSFTVRTVKRVKFMVCGG